VVDARSAVDVAGVLRDWLDQQFGGEVVDAEAPRTIGTGFSTIIHYVSGGLSPAGKGSQSDACS